MRIATNTQSMLAQRRLSQVNREHEIEETRLSSGDRIFKAALDPAGLAISQMMKAKNVSMGQAGRNINDGISLLQVAEGTLSILHATAARLRELALQASSDTVADQQRKLADIEFQNMKEEVVRLTGSTKFNGNYILNGEGSIYDLQIGINNKPGEDRLTYDLKKVLSSAKNFGLNGRGITSKIKSQSVLGPLDKMIETISKSRARLGASENRMVSSLNNLQISKENLSASQSTIKDADVAKVASNRAKLSIIKNASVAMLAQANNKAKNVLKLLE